MDDVVAIDDLVLVQTYQLTQRDLAYDITRVSPKDRIGNEAIRQNSKMSGIAVVISKTEVAVSYFITCRDCRDRHYLWCEL